MRIIAPFGFYGWGNIGDEATLQGFGRLMARVAPQVHGWVGSRSPRQTRRAEPAFRYFDAGARRNLWRYWAWRTADAMIVAGGTPIADALGHWPLSEVLPLVSRASAAGMPSAFIGIGTEELRHDDSPRHVATSLAPRVALWSTRTERDRRRLIEYGVPETAVTTAADMAWELERVPSDSGRGKLAALGINPDAFIVGVNVNIEEFMRAAQPRFLHDLAQFLDGVVDSHDARILFLCNEVRETPTFDLAASREVVAAMRRKDRATIVPNEYFVPQAMMSLVGCCRFTITTRYHFCVFSALQGIPFIAVGRSTKVSDLSHDLEWPYTIDLRDVAVAKLAALFSEMAAREADLRNLLGTAVTRMRNRARVNESALATFLGTATTRKGRS